VADLTTRQLLTVRETAEFLRISPRAPWTLYNAGRIPCVRLTSRTIRFDPADLEKWVLEKKTGGAR
jgi:excisionase family DNA binding protein